ncbi:MAG: hypothetical protein K6F19_04590 [Oscillospiraceae bacterium]|nr:hypothetical protein [Oscillospiraceae bacterium]
MKASFSYAIRYRITATCRSPLRTGDAANNPDRILTTHEGFAMLPGSSIAGAMKAWLGRDQRTAALFGSQKQESAVRISDALFREEDLAVTRPRIRIDRETGAAADEAKFDVTALPAGSVCSFELLWRGKKEEARSAAEIIERCLGAVNSGEISFGAQKNNGYGQMSLEITASEYDLFQKQDRLAWLDDRPNRKRTVTPPKNEMTDIVFSVEKCHAAVLVKAAAARRDDKKSIQTQFKENGRTIIPSSSLKGVMRTHMELIAPFLSVSEDTLTALFGKVPSREEKQKKLFGTEEQKQEASAGRILWTDATPDEQTEKSVLATRIRINKLTAGVLRRALITEEPVTGDWRWKIHVPADEKLGSLLTLYALRDLGLGMYQLGGTKSIGRGTVTELSVKILCGKQEAALSVANGTVRLEDRDGLIEDWEATVGGNEHGN